MNRDRVLLLATTIELHALKQEGLFGVIGFNMAEYIYVPEPRSERYLQDHVDGCGTVACIAGWCSLMAVGEKTVKANINDYNALRNSLSDTIDGLHVRRRFSDFAQDYLGLSTAQSYILFLANGAPKHLVDITAADAVKVLRHLADTGKVDWGIIADGRVPDEPEDYEVTERYIDTSEDF